MEFSSNCHRDLFAGLHFQRRRRDGRRERRVHCPVRGGLPVRLPHRHPRQQEGSALNQVLGFTSETRKKSFFTFYFLKCIAWSLMVEILHCNANYHCLQLRHHMFFFKMPGFENLKVKRGNNFPRIYLLNRISPSGTTAWKSRPCSTRTTRTTTRTPWPGPPSSSTSRGGTRSSCTHTRVREKTRTKLFKSASQKKEEGENTIDQRICLAHPENSAFDQRDPIRAHKGFSGVSSS